MDDSEEDSVSSPDDGTESSDSIDESSPEDIKMPNNPKEL